MASKYSKDRAVTGYLSPSLAPKFERFIQTTGISKSEALNDAVRLLLQQSGGVVIQKTTDSKNIF